MAKVISFSRNFPGHHPDAGKPTHFVEMFWTSRFKAGVSDFQLNAADTPFLKDQLNQYTSREFVSKNHTIREGHRFKAGELFSPRVWSARPYWSRPIIIGPDTLITNTWDFELRAADEDGLGAGFFLNGIWTGGEALTKVAHNDGLGIDQFNSWFKKPFAGQIICWNKETNY